MKFHAFAGPLLAAAIPLLLFELMTSWSSMDTMLRHPSGHFYIVSSVAALSTVIAILAGVAGSRLRNIEVSCLSLAFISLAEMFAVHGFSTPGFVMGPSSLTGIAAQLSVFLAAVWLALSSLSSDHPLVLSLSRWKNSLVPIWTVSLGLFALVGIVFPSIVDIVPWNRNPIKSVVVVITMGLHFFTMYRYYQSYRYSRFPLQLSIVYSCALQIAAQVIMVSGKTWMLSWWIYHYLLLISMLVMLIGLIMQYASNKSIVGALKALFTRDPIERITNSISPSVKALILATETKDPYTAGHNFRVTMYALRLAEELQATPEQLRALAQGAIVHDVGKINVPDSILNKPGKLTDEERLVIEQHPVKGYELCRSLGFMKEELDIIRSHHERWDGSGYPDRLQGERIPRLARIVAVADVYDALTSNRSYRQARSHSEALAFLQEQKGKHFDPVCVDAWVRLCERDPQAYQYPAAMIREGGMPAAAAATGGAAV
ncbi:HD-GYP domain-containing protein [Paenibacillus ginsengarvi]|uniref:HD-GYP domain-containing protein n=1 Tax=Paenibacillus ginsengarvi TaxID=400777 RepID=A0A3B0CLI7_9BACL|nr:HD-GYP domain-containing protein [Paenibacillus ginsengarvi]RKN85840.1 HD-GYP domain-containing protein [Paenibacillus ginsengarvi]